MVSTIVHSQTNDLMNEPKFKENQTTTSVNNTEKETFLRLKDETVMNETIKSELLNEENKKEIKEEKNEEKMMVIIIK